MNGPVIGSMFTGYGGLDMGVRSVIGGRVAWTSDIDPGACKIIARHHADVPNLGDISSADFTTVERVNVLTGGFPCQDLSVAGRQAGLGGARSGLWSHMLRAVDTIRPRLVVAENVRGILSVRADSDVEPCPWCMGDAEGEPHLRALGAVLADLAGIGYDARWYGVRASDVGAPHQRFRVFIFAHPADADGLGPIRPRTSWGRGNGLEDSGRPVPNAARQRREQGRTEPTREQRGPDASISCHDTRPPSDTDRVHVRVEHRDRTVATARTRSVGTEGFATDADSDGFPGIGRIEHVEHDPHGRTGGEAPFWPYAAAIARWEEVTGPAPSPTRQSPRGGPHLSPAFVEWMMGLPPGHVTDTRGVSRAGKLKALGNGVVPQQAAAALRLFLQDMEGTS